MTWNCLSKYFLKAKVLKAKSILFTNQKFVASQKGKSTKNMKCKAFVNAKKQYTEDEQFGNKASFVKTDTGVIVGALGFRNEYDGHTLPSVLDQVERLTGKAPKKAKVNRGYRGKKQIGITEILIPSPQKNQIAITNVRN